MNADILDSAPFGPLQRRVVLLCGIVALLDGFDMQVIAYVAPRMADSWGLAPASFAQAFAAGPLGLAAGAFLVSPIADRIGRKPVIIGSTLLFGLFALLTAGAQTLGQLVALRFLTGIGLGAAMPNIIALTGEYAPRRLRGTLITLMFGGLPLGSAIGGFISHWLMAAHDWQAVFLLGGVLPLLLVLLLLWLLPESPGLVASLGRPTSRIASILRQIDPTADVDLFIKAKRHERVQTPRRLTVTRLFGDGRAPVTLLLWLIYFANLLAMYFLVNWLPTLLREAGLPLSMAILSTATLNFGGAAGGVALGWLIDRYSPLKMLGWSYAIAILAIAGLAFAGFHLVVVIAAAIIAGFTMVGAQTGCHVITTLAYPAPIRATGLGWALGVGRLGAIVGPLIGGTLLAAAWQPHSIILAATVPTAIALSAILLLARFLPAR